MRITRWTIIGAGLCLLPSCERAPSEDAITAADFAWRVGVLAHDSMGGRDTPSPGLEAAAQWIAGELERFGLEGGADNGGFVQRYPLRSRVVKATESFVAVGVDTLRFGTDVLPIRGSAASMGASAPLAVVTGATSVTSELAAQIEGRHVIVVPPNRSGRVDRETLRVAVGLAAGDPVSVWIVDALDDDEWQSEARRLLTPSYDKAWGVEGPGPQSVAPLLRVRRGSLVRFFTARDVDPAEVLDAALGPTRVREPIASPAVLRLTVGSVEVGAPNVVGILRGGDPTLADEYVVFSAHMDHVGFGAPDEAGDSIFNGADDDASGTTAVLEIAEAMAALDTPPGRSAVFLFVSGEEKGLWGSEWFAEHPTVPGRGIVANLNLDMVGRNWPDTIVAIGRQHSDLGETLERVSAEHPELGIAAIDDPWPEESFYTRSDHYNFARRGVPVLFFFNGTHEDYHGRDDEPDRIDAEKAARIALLVYYLGLEVANQSDRPAWNGRSLEAIVSDPY